MSIAKSLVKSSPDQYEGCSVVTPRSLCEKGEDAFAVCLNPAEDQSRNVWSYDAKGDEFALSKHHGNLSARPW